jgi:hypothetical protein
MLWKKVEGLIAAKQPKSYDQAVELLLDLHDLAARKNGADFRRRAQALRAAQANVHRPVAQGGTVIVAIPICVGIKGRDRPQSAQWCS